MYITVTPEVKAFLEIENTLLKTSNQDLPIEIGILSEKEFLCILPENFIPNKVQTYHVRLKVKDMYHIIDVQFKDRLNDCLLSRFEYNLQAIPSQVRERFMRLFKLNEKVQKRKEVRIELNTDNVGKMKIGTYSSFLYENTLTECVLKDVSFSGAHFLALGDLPFVFVKKSTALKISFAHPSESFFILSEVIRKNSISTGEQNLSSIAVSFSEPINIKYLSRLSSYFN